MTAAKKITRQHPKQRIESWQRQKKKKPTVTIDKPDSLVSMKVSKGYKESFDALIESGKF